MKWSITYTFIAIVLIFPHLGSAQNKAADSIQKKAANDNAHAKPLVLPVIQPDKAPNKQNPGASVAPKDVEQPVRFKTPITVNSIKDPWDKALVIFTGLIIIVGFAQIIFLWRTVSATRDNAEAALLNAKVLIGAERPWLLVSILPIKDEPGYHVVRAINRGETPAEMSEGHCACKSQPITGFIPPDDISDPFFAPMENLTFHGEEFEIRIIKPDACISEDDLAGMNPKNLRIYGKILYWDTFSDRTKVKPYVTQWDFTYNLRTRHFYRSPGSYTRNT